MPRKKGQKKHGFASKDQWRWAFATRKSWARKWAHRSRPFKSLPKNKR